MTIAKPFERHELAFSHRDLEILQQAFELACSELDVPPEENVQAMRVADAVMSAWNAGARDPNMLIGAAVWQEAA